jgi:hypothetical protein
MLSLTSHHPAQLVLGSIIIGEQLATKGRQTTFAILCRDAVEWATETRDLLREIATDAEHLHGRIRDFSADGVFTPAESAELQAYALEIHDEAITGKIINSR